MSIFRSAGCVLLHVEFNTRCCGCGPKEPVCSLVHCVCLYPTYSRIYTPIFRSTGCVLLHMVFSTRCCGCGPKEPVCSLVHCVCVCIRLTVGYKLTTPSAEHHMQQHTTCTPEDGHIDVRNM